MDWNTLLWLIRYVALWTITARVSVRQRLEFVSDALKCEQRRTLFIIMPFIACRSGGSGSELLFRPEDVYLKPLGGDLGSPYGTCNKTSYIFPGQLP